MLQIAFIKARYEEHYLLLLWSSLLSSFLGCWFLGSLLWLLCLLGSWLLGLLDLLWLLGLWLLSLRLLGGQLERSSSLLASSSCGNNLLGSNHLLESKTDTDSSLGSINLVVGHDILEDGLAGRSLLVSKSLDSSSDHAGIR